MSETQRLGWSWRGLAADAALLLVVVGLCVKAVAGGAEFRDADGADECAYTISASAVPTRGLPVVEGSPLYILWLSFVLKAGVPLMDAQYASWAVLSVALCASVFVCARALGGGRVAALTAGGLLPATTLIDIWPYPMHLATVILVLGAALAGRIARAGRPAPAGATVGLALLTATYARPEFFYSLVLFVPLALLGAAWLLWRRTGASRAVLASAVALVGGAGLLVWALGSPKGEGGRSVAAFGQHYAVNRHLAGAKTDNPWLHWEEYMKGDFGTLPSPEEAWKLNREAFLRHVGTNAKKVPEQLRLVAAPWIDLTWLRVPYVWPLPAVAPKHPRTEAITNWILLALLSYGFVGALVGLYRLRRGSEEGRGLVVGAAMLALVAAPAVAAVLVIYPRLHYLLPTVTFSVALAAAGFRHAVLSEQWRAGRLVRHPATTTVAVLGLAVGLALIVPNRANGWCIQMKMSKSGPRQLIVPLPAPTRASVKTLRELDLRGPVLMMDNGSARSVYAGYGEAFASPAHMLPGEGFLQFVKRVNIGIAALEPILAAYPQLRDDPDYRALIEGKESAQFRVVTVEGYPYLKFAIRRDLLAPP